MRIIVMLLVLVVAVVMVIFGAQNTRPVTVQFLNYASGEVSLSLVIVIAAMLGAMLSALLNLSSSIQRSLRDRGARRRLEARNRELEDRVALLERERSAPKPAVAPSEPRPTPKP
jgi:uncharacterized membrane protein YciS (DUF1049 family)